MKEAFLQSWGLLTFAAKRKVLITTCLTILLSGLDFIAVALIGLVGALAIRGIQSQGIGDRTNQVLSILDLQDLTLSVQIIVLGLAAFFMLILRSVMTYLFTRRIFLFMSNQSTELASLLLSKILSKPVDYVQRKSSQEYIFHINVGTGHLMMGVIGNAFTIISDLALFLMLVVLLLVADFQSALVTALSFGLIGLMLNTIMQKRAISLGNEAKKSAIYINEAISELFISLREIRTKNTTKIYEERVKRGRAEIIRIAADIKMMPIFSKYVIEISIFTLFLFIAAIQFTFNDTARAVGNLALFFAASTRMSPAVLRMQQNFIQMKGAIGGGKGTLELLKIEHIKDSNAISNFKSGDFTPSVNFEGVSFSYGEDQDWRLGPLNFQVPPLSFVAFVGGSGAGKSTIIDLIFGLLKPQEGNVTISGRPASVALKTWPGKFGYVPQNVAIHKGTVLSNLLLGMEENEENIQSSLEALQLVGLGETSGNPKFGLKTELDERGSNLSGGQRQRLGIARAIVSKPELLILDESTSSLDAISESLITESLDILRGKLTIIVIAHRLSTVKKADILYYVERGKILAEGDFNSLRRKVPDFDLQSKLMGM